MAEIYSHPGPETRMTKFDGREPTQEENEAAMKDVIAQILDRKPCALVIYAEFKANGGGVVAGAVGSPLTLAHLMRLGQSQVEEMMRRSLASGENG